MNAVGYKLKLPHLTPPDPDRSASRVTLTAIFEWTECDLNKHTITDEYHYSGYLYSHMLTSADWRPSRKFKYLIVSKR